MKKIISLLSAFAMIASMAVSVSAAEAPEIKLVLNFAETGENLSAENYDGDWNYYEYHGAPVYKAELSIEGVSAKSPIIDGGRPVAFKGCTVNSVEAVFDCETEEDIVLISYNGFAGSEGGYVDGDITYAYTSASNFMKTNNEVIGTWYFVAKDMGSIEDMKIAAKSGENLIVKIEEYYDGTSMGATLSQIAVTPTVVAYPAAPAGPTAEAMKDGVLVEGGLHDGKTSATTSVFEGEVDTIKVTNSKGGEQTASLPELLGNGYTKIMTVILYNAVAMKDSTFNVKYFAGETLVKEYTYDVK